MIKRQLRHGVFETNSSSSHSVSISNVGSLTSVKPNRDGIINISLGEYGWGVEEHFDFETKASYLFTDLVYNNSTDFQNISKIDYINMCHQGLADIRLLEEHTAGMEITKLRDLPDNGYNVLLTAHVSNVIPQAKRIIDVIKNFTGADSVVIDFTVDYYVDHQSCGTSREVLSKSDDTLKAFLFDNSSKLRISNDNGGDDDYEG